MTKFYQLTLATAIMFALVVSIAPFAMAQWKVNIDDGPIKKADWLNDPAGELNEDHSKVKTWITKWYGPDGNYENNGTFQVSGKKDLIDEGTNGKLTEIELSTIDGLKQTQTIKMAWAKKHGGTRDWTVFELDPADSHHMNRDGPTDNIDTYGICVIDAPEDMKSVMSPAHDDHAQIWINGESGMGPRETTKTTVVSKFLPRKTSSRKGPTAN